jgi:hypothetical protein
VSKFIQVVKDRIENDPSFIATDGDPSHGKLAIYASIELGHSFFEATGRAVCNPEACEVKRPIDFVFDNAITDLDKWNQKYHCDLYEYEDEFNMAPSAIYMIGEVIKLLKDRRFAALNYNATHRDSFNLERGHKIAYGRALTRLAHKVARNEDALAYLHIEKSNYAL